MAKLNIAKSDLVNEVREIKDEIMSDMQNIRESKLLFFGNLEDSMHEIDAAILKLQKLSVDKNGWNADFL